MKHRLLTAIILCAVLLLSACRQETISPTDGGTEPPITIHFHQYTAGERISPTCEEDGYIPMVCSCGFSYRASVVNATGHSYTRTQVVAPTKTESGYSVYTCDYCDKSYHADKTPPLGSEGIAGMTFEEYMSVERTHSRINAVHWTTSEGKEYRLRVDRQGLAVISKAEIVCRVPNTESLSKFTLIGCNGELAFLTTQTQIVQVDIATGAITPLAAEAEAVLEAWLCDDYFLYYAAYDADEDELQIFMHSYLPKGGQLSIIPHIPANGTPLSQFFFPAPETNSQAVVFYTMSTKMLERIQQELADPDSPYRFDQRIQVAALWEDPDRIYDPAYANKVRVLSRTLQNEHHIAPHTCYTGVLGEGIQAQRDTTAPDPKPLPQKYRPLEVICYHPDYTDMYPGYDFTGCTPGHYYAGNRITKELTWLYDDTLVRCEEQQGVLFNHRSKGQYIYYTRKDDPTNIYRMDYKGIVKDELVYQGDPNVKLDFLVISNTHDYEQLAILQGDQIYILDLQEDTCTKVYEADNIYGLWSYKYEASSKSFIVAYESNGYCWHYNITTGEMKQYSNL